MLLYGRSLALSGEHGEQKNVKQFTNALTWLKAMGCETDYASSAVDVNHQSIESVIHELSHAVVCRLCLEKDFKGPARHALDVDSLTERVAARVGPMRKWEQDRNEETSLAVGMVVLDALFIPYNKQKFINGVDWKTKRPHVLFVDQALRRPTTRRHARRILSYLRYLNNKPVPTTLDVRTAQD